MKGSWVHHQSPSATSVLASCIALGESIPGPLNKFQFQAVTKANPFIPTPHLRPLTNNCLEPHKIGVSGSKMHKRRMQLKSQSRSISSICRDTRCQPSSDTPTKVTIKGGKSAVAPNQRIHLILDGEPQDPKLIQFKESLKYSSKSPSIPQNKG